GAKEELKEIENITDPKEQYKKVNSAYMKHSSNLSSANSYYNQLGGDTSGVNWTDESKYSGVVNKLKGIKDKYEGENNKSNGSSNISVTKNCSECKNSITGQYFQKDGKYFCSQYCFNNYYVCDKCQQKITGEYYSSGSNINKNKKGI